MRRAAVVIAVLVVRAFYVGDKEKASRKILLDGVVRASGTAAEKLYSGFGECGLRPAADSAADKDVRAAGLEKSRKGAVTASVGV